MLDSISHMKAKIEIYQELDKLFRWRLVYRGKTIAEGGRGYVKRASVTQAISNATWLMSPSAPIVDLTLNVRTLS